MNYRDEVTRLFVNHVKPEDYLTMGALGLAGEAGEVIDLIKKHKFQGRELDRDKLINELGDVRWYIEVLLHAIQSDMAEVENVNVTKLRRRYPNGFTTENSILKLDQKTIDNQK